MKQITALTPLDGRYASRVTSLTPIFSEYGLIHRRVLVEISWLKASVLNPASPKPVRLPPTKFSSSTPSAAIFPPGTLKG